MWTDTRCWKVMVFCAMLLVIGSRADAQTPTCPDSPSTTVHSGSLYGHSSTTYSIDLLPCETVLVEMTGSTLTTGRAAMALKIRNHAGQSLATTTFMCVASCSAIVPETFSWVGFPLRGTRGVEGLAKDVVISTSTFTGQQPATYTLTIRKTPRPQYNVGGTSFSNAPSISTSTLYYGSLHQWEPGQFYKLTVGAGQLIYLVGQATGSESRGAGFKIELYDSSQQYIKLLVHVSAYGTDIFPGNGVYDTYRNTTAQAADYYLKVRTNSWPTHDFNFQVRAPLQSQLTLFLDADNNFEANQEDDAANYVPGSVLATGASVPVTPEGTYLQQVRIVAAFVDEFDQIIPPPVGVTAATFALENTSAFTGYAMNAGSSTAADFTLANTSASFNNNRAIGRLNVFDYGGFTTVRVTAGSNIETIRIPKDDDNNWISDAGWHAENTTIEAAGLDKSLDEDNSPSVQGSPSLGVIGDGLLNFEEYRGFIVRGEHRRTNPFQKDVFISSNLTTGIAFAYPNLPTTTHRINGEDEVGTDEYRTSDRVVSGNYENAGYGNNLPGRSASNGQKAIRVREVADDLSFYGCTFSIGASGCLTTQGNTAPYTTPNEIDRIEVYLGPHNRLANSPDNYIQTQIDNELKRTTGHEVGHALHICHRPGSCSDGDVGEPDSIMSTPLFGGPDGSDPASQYNSTDKDQIRVHLRF